MLGTKAREASRAPWTIEDANCLCRPDHTRDAHPAATIRFIDRRNVWQWIVVGTLVVLWTCGVSDMAASQTCAVSGSSVSLASGTCAIAPNTTLNGTPAVHATTSAQITTNNVTINPFNGGSIGGLAETNGTIIFSSGSSINGNWSTAASAQTGGQQAALSQICQSSPSH
jgi:hypothetical protein